MEYASGTKELKINMNYNGSAFDPFEGDGEDLGVTLIRGLCAAKEYDNFESKNTLSLLLK